MARGKGGNEQDILTPPTTVSVTTGEVSITGDVASPGDAEVLATNSTTTPLNAGATYTGSWVDVSAHSSVTVAITTDQHATYYAEFSPDGTNADSSLTRYYRTGEINAPDPFVVLRKYFRLRITNTSASNQTYLRAQCMAGAQSPTLNIPTDSIMSQRYPSISTRPTDYKSEAALGRRQNQTVWNKFGYNDDVDTGAQETVWHAGGLIVPMTTARTLSIVSADANDTAAGTGARTVTIYGLSSARLYQTETVTLNGTTPVVTSNTWLGVNRCVVASAGTGLTNAGAITATATTDATTQFKMPAGCGTTQFAFFYTQAGHTALADFLKMSALRITGGGASPRVIFRAYVRNFLTGVRMEVLRQYIDTAVENHVVFATPEPFVIPEQCLLEFTAESDTNNTQVSVRFSLIEHKNVGA